MRAARRRRRGAAYLVLLLWLGAWPATVERATADAGAGGRAPSHARLRPRQRAGVMVEPGAVREPLAEMRAPDVLSARELRRLALRAGVLGAIEPTRWPPEPPTPAVIEPARLAAALGMLCPPTITPSALQATAAQIVQAARQFDVDALLLGALIYHQSACEPSRRNSWGAGLTMLNPGLLPAELHRGQLRYSVRGTGGAWSERSLPFEPALPMERAALLDPATNVQVAAALLRMFREQCAGLDELFHSVAHRHHVSHFIWGDQVRGRAPEDAVLTARRRLLRYYGVERERMVEVEGQMVSCPLDGAPRIVTSGLGDAREGGRRAHAGVDFLSHVGEPVRAVAAGTVRRAGSDLADGTLLDVAPERAALLPERAMGVRGLFVEIAHAHGLRSIYAHLASYTVRAGEQVERGQLLGYVGRSGVRESDPHLHFGLFKGAQVIDPRTALAPLLFAPGLELRDARPPQARE